MKKPNFLKSILLIIFLATACQEEDHFIEPESLQKTNRFSINSNNVNQSSNFLDFGCESSNYKYDYSKPSFIVGEREDLLWGINGHSLRTSYPGYNNPYDVITFEETINFLKKTGAQVYRNDIHVGINGNLTLGESDDELDRLLNLLGEENIEFLPMIYTSSYKNFLNDDTPFSYSNIGLAMKLLDKTVVQDMIVGSEIWTANYSQGYEIGRNFGIKRGNSINYFNIGNENAYRIINNVNGNGSGEEIDNFFSSEDRAKHIVGSTAFTKGVIDGIKNIKSDAICIVNETTSIFGYFDFLNYMDVSYDIIGWNWYSTLGDFQSVYDTLNTLSGHKPIWITEINRTHGSSSTENFDEQSIQIRRFMEEVYNLPNVKAFLVYELLDGSNGSNENEDYFGLITGIPEVKPAFNTYRYSIEEFNFGYHDFMYSYYTLYKGNAIDIEDPNAVGGGINYWANRFKEGLEIPQFLDLYMDIDASNFINDSYMLLLDRSVDSSGKNYYLNQLQNSLTREWVMADIVSSDSFYNKSNNPENNYNGASSNENFIYHVYNKLLARNPSAIELSNDTFDDIDRDSRRSYALSFLNKEEYLTQFITEQYNIYLSRIPDTNGLEHHISEWLDQKGFLIKLMTSEEFWRKSVIRGNCERQ